MSTVFIFNSATNVNVEQSCHSSGTFLLKLALWFCLSSLLKPFKKQLWDWENEPFSSFLLKKNFENLKCFSSKKHDRQNWTPLVEKQPLTNLPIRRNSPATPSRLMAMSSPRTVMPSQKQTTTRALGRRSRSFLSSLSKCFSPALL